MAQMPGLNARDTVSLIGAGGWRLVEQESSNMQFAHASRPGKVTIPAHSGTLSIGLLKSIFNQAGLTDVFKALQRGTPMKKIERALRGRDNTPA